MATPAPRMTYEVEEPTPDGGKLIIGQTRWGTRGIIAAWHDKAGHVSQRTSVTEVERLPQMLSFAIREGELPLSVLRDIWTDVAP